MLLLVPAARAALTTARPKPLAAAAFRLHIARSFYAARPQRLPATENGDGQADDAEIRRRVQVLPFVKGRTAATNRMWINRFLATKQQQAIENTNTAVSTEPRPVLHKHMKDSYIEEYLLFRSEPDVREEYLSAFSQIRIGKILEDLDALCGSIAYLHCDDGRADTAPLKIVTASLDRIDLLQPIPGDKDIRISGHVTWVGSSSMAVSCWVETVEDETAISTGPGGEPSTIALGKTAAEKRVPGKPILAAKFTMVARDPVTGRAAKINQLKLDTEEDRRLFRIGATHRAQLIADKQFDLSSTPPTFEEMSLVHSLYSEYIQYIDPSFNKEKPSSIVWMKDTIQQTLVLCHPQSRNIHGNIFGGFLLRLAFELAHATSLLFAGTPVHFVALDDISFRKPVHVSDILALTAQVTYSAPPSRGFQVKVRANVLNAIEGTQNTTNEFHFTFEAEKDVARIMPRSYDESMRYIEGKRKKERWLHFAEHNKAIFKNLRADAPPAGTGRI
ncbi:Acyl-coenzyme A thioesterase 9, mitochondrial [Geranomyces variabilis]|nr:Acyl-coenzyme A thioesterase 9, mitochondrial [Geranomyces variabilis]